MSEHIRGSMIYSNVTISGHVSVGDLLALALSGVVLALGVWLIIVAGRRRGGNHATDLRRKFTGSWTGSIAGVGGLLIVGGVLLASSTVAAILTNLIRVTG